MKPFKRILTIALLLLLTLSAGAQSITEAQARRQINAAAARMRTLTCDFVQTKSLQMLKSKIVSKGKMYYVNNQSVWMKNDKGTNRINVSQSKMFKEITRIMMSSVVGSCVTDNRDFDVTLQGKDNNWKAMMKPKRNPMKQMFRTITVYFDLKRQMVIGVRMIEKNGDTTAIVLKNASINTPINEKVFSLH